MLTLALLAGAVHMTIAPASALVDQPVDVRVTGLPPRASVTLTATTHDGRGATWRSRVPYRADARGVVDTHGGARIFWSMRSRANRPFRPAFGSTPVTIAAVLNGRVVARGALVRRGEAAGVVAHATTLPSEGFVGAYFRAPPGSAPAPAVLVIGGSGGGYSAYLSALLASRGYPSLALAYVLEPGLPQTLQDIPLEYFATALRWLGGQPGVDPHRIAILGASRGGEAALLLGATYPDLVRGVIAASPLDQVAGGIPSGFAWTLGGKPVPLGSIPVENVAGPVLAFAGGKDELSSSVESLNRIQARARSHGRLDVQTVPYPKAGHGVVSVPNIPGDASPEYRPGVFVSLGGSPAANAAAHVDSWRRILRFLAALR